MDTEQFVQLFLKHRVELTILVVSIVATAIAFVLSSITTTSIESEELVVNEPIVVHDDIDETDDALSEVYVEISGSVKKPGVYKLAHPARLNDVLKKANGLSQDADRGFFNRNYNLARIVIDQEKIHVPSSTEVDNNIFTEESYFIQQNKLLTEDVSSEASFESGLIDINSASISDLDTLPGVGKVTAEKIISLRPYQSTQELLDRKVVSKNTFDKIVSLIEVK